MHHHLADALASLRDPGHRAPNVYFAADAVGRKLRGALAGYLLLL